MTHADNDRPAGAERSEPASDSPSLDVERVHGALRETMCPLAAIWRDSPEGVTAIQGAFNLREIAQEIVRALPPRPQERDAVIEEAARVAEKERDTWHNISGNPASRIASAIRALKGAA